ncbi:MAG TPA: Uma2 family endonuclease [Pseudonocardiaceae bacterium]|nr:Uma2 family endonuclease [Pseudonocardiaceae bacterium]
MTALPEPDPESEPRLLTVAEYAALGETDPGYTELQEGHILMSPSPVPDHNVACLNLCVQLITQLPDDLEAIQDIDIDLELAPKEDPGFSRRPDLVVVDRTARQRVRSEGGLLRAAEVKLVVEIVSPGSVRMDNVIKLGEYADAGIPHYWILDLRPPTSMHVWHLAGEFGYQDSGTFTDQFSLMDPFKVDVDLGRLL